MYVILTIFILYCKCLKGHSLYLLFCVLDINTYVLFNSVMKYFRLNIICIHHKDQRKKEANL
jgi:hypothetical protein